MKNTPRPANPKLLKFTDKTYRENLVRATGIEPGKLAEAHHNFPQAERLRFKTKFGINIDEPQFLSWVEKSKHRSMSPAYNTKWEKDFFKKGRTDFLEFAKELAEEFNYNIGF